MKPNHICTRDVFFPGLWLLAVIHFRQGFFQKYRQIRFAVDFRGIHKTEDILKLFKHFLASELIGNVVQGEFHFFMFIVLIIIKHLLSVGIFVFNYLFYQFNCGIVTVAIALSLTGHHHFIQRNAFRFQFKVDDLISALFKGFNRFFITDERGLQLV
ncbi:hypothetical protein DSECCO2_621050 [anaerobic digester metagenome]